MRTVGDRLCDVRWPVTDSSLGGVGTLAGATVDGHAKAAEVGHA
jgi:hypothetical protein